MQLKLSLNICSKNKWLSHYASLFVCMMGALWVALVYSVNANANLNQLLANEIHELVEQGVRVGKGPKAMPCYVWRHLGRELENKGIDAKSLLALASPNHYQRIVVYKSKDYSHKIPITVPFAVVAIILDKGQSTVVHDHTVSCGPLLVNGKINELYGYTETFDSSYKVAVLNGTRSLKRYVPDVYLTPEKDNTHMLKESSGQAPAIAFNLYVDENGNSVNDTFPVPLKVAPNGMGVYGRLDKKKSSSTVK